MGTVCLVFSNPMCAVGECYVIKVLCCAGVACQCLWRGQLLSIRISEKCWFASPAAAFSFCKFDMFVLNGFTYALF